MFDFTANTSFNDLDRISKKELIDYLLDYKLKFKDNYGLPCDLRFGIEIEVSSPKFISKMRKRNDILYYDIPERIPLVAYDRGQWILTSDTSLGKTGGEIDSPILSDTKADWQDLKSMLLYIKKRVKYAKVDDFCAAHSHYDGCFFDNDPETLLSFMALLAENEDILTRFYNGEFINLRYAASDYAPSFAKFLYSRLPYLNSASYDGFLDSLYNENRNTNLCDYAFDFYRLYLYSRGERVINTFENRIPNGSLEETIIANNIMVTGSLMQYAREGNFDYEKSLSDLEQNGPRNRNDNGLDFERAFYVADFLPTNGCKLDFLKQYVKDGTEVSGTTLKKSLEFF